MATAPRTIYDFGGFPRELYEMTYPALGDPVLARRGSATARAKYRCAWMSAGDLTMAAWAVLCHVYPHADALVVQLSIDETQPPSFYYDEIGQRLASLREEGILIIGSGNVVHNLHAYAWGRHTPEPWDWVIAFERRVRDLLLAEQHRRLIDYEQKLGRQALLAAPTPDHYLPPLYVIGARTSSERVEFPVEGVDGGSFSMLAVQIG